MRRRFLVLLTFLFAIQLLHLPFLQAQDPGQSPEKIAGTSPRSSAAKYRAHSEKDGFSIGAERLTRKEASRVFAADVNRCCLIVHVAVYPKKGDPTELSASDFTLVDVQGDIPLRPESATTIAARLERKKNPTGPVDVTPVANVGYQVGTYIDPITGQPTHVHGVSAGGGVIVSPSTSSPPDIADRDRDFIEHELYEKALPEATVSVPVSGYLYFPIPKPNKSTKYRLVYSGKAEPLTLTLP
jgi:hypothetical protein